MRLNLRGECNMNTIDVNQKSNPYIPLKNDNASNSVDTLKKSVDEKESESTIIDKLKNCYPQTTVTIKSMTDADIDDYCKNSPIDYSRFDHGIIVSPKVLEKMKEDPKYAKQMLAKIKDAAIPRGFGNAMIYEYKVIVKDDGEIITVSCADFMNGKKQKVDDDDDDKKKKIKKELERMHEEKLLEIEQDEKASIEQIAKGRTEMQELHRQVLAQQFAQGLL